MDYRPFLTFTRRIKLGKPLLKVEVSERAPVPSSRAKSSTQLEFNASTYLHSTLQRASDVNAVLHITFEVQDLLATVTWKTSSSAAITLDADLVEQAIRDAAAAIDAEFAQRWLAAAPDESQAAAAAVAKAETDARAAASAAAIPARSLAMGDLVSPSRVIKWPTRAVGRLIGTKGDVIRAFQRDFKVKIEVVPQGDDTRATADIRVTATNSKELLAAIKVLLEFREELQRIHAPTVSRTFYATPPAKRKVIRSKDDGTCGGGEPGVDEVPPFVFGPITGVGGAVKHSIEAMFGVKLRFDFDNFAVEVRGTDAGKVDAAFHELHLLMAHRREVKLPPLSDEDEEARGISARSAYNLPITLPAYTVEAGRAMVKRVVPAPRPCWPAFVRVAQSDVCYRHKIVTYAALLYGAPSTWSNRSSAASTAASTRLSSAAIAAGAGPADTRASDEPVLVVLVAAATDADADTYIRCLHEFSEGAAWLEEKHRQAAVFKAAEKLRGAEAQAMAEEDKLSAKVEAAEKAKRQAAELAAQKAAAAEEAKRKAAELAAQKAAAAEEAQRKAAELAAQKAAAAEEAQRKAAERAALKAAAAEEAKRKTAERAAQKAAAAEEAQRKAVVQKVQKTAAAEEDKRKAAELKASLAEESSPNVQAESLQILQQYAPQIQAELASMLASTDGDASIDKDPIASWWRNVWQPTVGMDLRSYIIEHCRAAFIVLNRTVISVAAPSASGAHDLKAMARPR